MWIEVNNAHPNKLVLGVGNNAEREGMENDHSHYFEYFLSAPGGVHQLESLKTRAHDHRPVQKWSNGWC
jgi:hypothetical protein